MSYLVFVFVQLAQPARLLLEYTGTKYENKFYVCGEGKDTPASKRYISFIVLIKSVGKMSL